MPAGIGIDAPSGAKEAITLRAKGKVKVLEDTIEERRDSLDVDAELNIHVGIAHTRWATHGAPSEINSHPQKSDPDGKFLVVHNGIITNYKDIKEYLINRGGGGDADTFESETDTEVIAKLILHLHNQNPSDSFRQLVEKCIQQLEGAFACCFRSSLFPGELVATRRGSPLLVGIKTERVLESDSIPVQYRYFLAFDHDLSTVTLSSVVTL